MTELPLTSVKDIRDYMFGGKAEFTLQSNVTGKHFTYRVLKYSDDKIRFVFFLGGSNNDTDWIYAGKLRRFKRDPNALSTPLTKNNELAFARTPKSPSSAAPVMQAFGWFIHMLNKDTIAEDQVTFLHSGKCSACGRKLTTPESIQTGMGPVCRSRL